MTPAQRLGAEVGKAERPEKPTGHKTTKFKQVKKVPNQKGRATCHLNSYFVAVANLPHLHILEPNAIDGVTDRHRPPGDGSTLPAVVGVRHTPGTSAFGRRLPKMRASAIPRR